MVIAIMQNNELAQLILNVIVQIPQGKVASYGQVAQLAGLPKHARLVGRVLGQLEDCLLYTSPSPRDS